MRRALAAAAVIIVTVIALPAVAGAIATSQFSIEPASGVARLAGTDRLVVTPKRGATGHTAVRVTNLRDETLALQMDVVPITVHGTGPASLGGSDRPVGWTDLDRDRVRLAPRESAVVEVSVHVPRKATAAERTVGILATPIAAEGAPAPSVVQQLALVVYIRPHGTAPRPIVLIGIALAIVVAVFAAMILLAPRLERRRG